MHGRSTAIMRSVVRGALRLFVKRIWHRQPTIEQLRALVASADRWATRLGPAPAAEAADAGGVPAEWIGAKATGGAGVLLYLHGGAFVVHMPEAYRRLAARLAQASGLRVLLPDYRLAPEHPFPAALDDCARAYAWLLGQGVPAQRIAVAGDSAGGNLTLALLMRLRDASQPLPAAAAVLSPVTDLTGSGVSIERNEASDWLFAKPALGLVHRAYLDERGADVALVSPLFGSWAGLPPLLFHVSGSEMLLDDSLRAVERARAAGVDASVRVWPDMPHVFQLLPWFAEAGQSVAAIGAFAATQLAPKARAAPAVAPLVTPPQETSAMESVIIGRMQAAFERQRVAFLAQPFPDLAERKRKLRALRTLLQRWQDRIAVAVGEDFGGRSPAETKLVEVLGPILEINHALHKLRRWMKPERRHTELLFLTNRVQVRYQPKGVVGVITPWNFPLYLSLGPLVAALAAGNRVMIKMSELSPRTTELLATMLAEAFAEDEVAVFGGEVAAAQAFSNLPFNHLVFTGSPAVGKHVMRAAAGQLTPVTLELGGKSPVIVSADRPVDEAAVRVAHGKAFSSGQVCLAPDYALVPRGQVGAFASAVERHFRRLYPQVQGNPDYTSMVCEPHAARIHELIDDARAKGGTVTRCGDLGPGRRIPLHVVTNVRDDMRIMQEELFGPILPVLAYDTLDDAIDYITARPRPLALYPFGFGGVDLERLLTLTHSGGVSVNDWGWHAFNHDLPFGGSGNSGMGSYHGIEGFRELSHPKATFARHRWFPIGLFYPPYGNLVQRLVFKFYLGHADPALGASAPAQRTGH